MLDGNTDFSVALKKAQEIGAIMQASKKEHSRAHSLAMSHLETAQLWARQDEEEKGRVNSLQESETK